MYKAKRRGPSTWPWANCLLLRRRVLQARRFQLLCCVPLYNRLSEQRTSGYWIRSGLRAGQCLGIPEFWQFLVPELLVGCQKGEIGVMVLRSGHMRLFSQEEETYSL